MFTVGITYPIFFHDSLNSVPESCCKSPSPSCGKSAHPSNIPYTGCVHPLAAALGGWSGAAAAAAAAAAAVTAGAMAYAACVRGALRRLRLDLEEEERLRRLRQQERVRGPPVGGRFQDVHNRGGGRNNGFQLLENGQ